MVLRVTASPSDGAPLPGGETVRVGGESRKLFLKQETADPDVAAVSLSTATTTMRDALRDIAKLAKKAEAPKPAA